MLSRLLLLLIMSFSASAQQAAKDSLMHLWQFPAEVTAADFDAEGNLYVALDDGSLRLYNPLGLELQRYAPEGLPNFQQVYAFNRLQIIAFDADARRLYFLDRFLREKAQYQLPTTALMISHIAPANRSSFWLLDKGRRELHLWDYQNQQILFSIPWNQYTIFRTNDAPRQLSALGQQLALLTQQGKLMLLDQQGNLLMLYQQKPIRTIDLQPKQFYASVADTLWQIEFSEEGAAAPVTAIAAETAGFTTHEKMLFSWKGKEGKLQPLTEQLQPE